VIDSEQGGGFLLAHVSQKWMEIMTERTVGVQAGAWTELTTANVTEITFQNIGKSHVMLKGTVGAVPPTSQDGAFRYNPGQGERNVSLAKMFSGVAGANRIYVWADAPAHVVVHHA
jgi:hypothetical protein